MDDSEAYSCELDEVESIFGIGGTSIDEAKDGIGFGSYKTKVVMRSRKLVCDEVQTIPCPYLLLKLWRRQLKSGQQCLRRSRIKRVLHICL